MKRSLSIVAACILSASCGSDPPSTNPGVDAAADASPDASDTSDASGDAGSEVVPTDAPGSTCATGGAGITTRPVTTAGSFSTAGGDQSATLTIGGLAREVFTYLPAKRPANPPLLIALHGTGSGTDVGQGMDMGQRFEAMADAHGVAIAGPESRVQPQGDWDQHDGGEKYWETMPRDDPSRGCDPNRNPDLILLRAIIQEAKKTWNVDPKRIFLIGFSNGAFFSLRAAVAMRDQIASFTEMSGGLVTCDNTNSCSFGGTSTTCAGLASEADYCKCPVGGASEKPITLPTSGRMPAGNLTHGNQDFTVTVAYTCALAARMTALGHTVQVSIRAGADHAIPDFVAPSAYEPLWTFFDTHRLP